MEGPALARALEPLPICKACKLDPGYSGRVQMPTLEEPPTEVSPIGNP
jgi:hypothetical protein